MKRVHGPTAIRICIGVYMLNINKNNPISPLRQSRPHCRQLDRAILCAYNSHIYYAVSKKNGKKLQRAPRLSRILHSIQFHETDSFEKYQLFLNVISRLYLIWIISYLKLSGKVIPEEQIFFFSIDSYISYTDTYVTDKFRTLELPWIVVLTISGSITLKLLLESLLLLCHSPFSYCLWRIIKPTVKRILCARHCFWLRMKQTKTQRRCEAAATSRLISNHFQTYFISRSGSRLNIE